MNKMPCPDDASEYFSVCSRQSTLIMMERDKLRQEKDEARERELRVLEKEMAEHREMERLAKLGIDRRCVSRDLLERALKDQNVEETIKNNHPELHKRIQAALETQK